MSVYPSVCIAILFLTVQWLTIGGTPLSCPNVEDVSPCSCKRVAYGLHVVCANFNDSSSLQRSFRILRDYTVHNILVHGVYLSSNVPSDLFVGMQIKELRVEKSKLLFDQPAFTGLDSSLNVLNVAHCSLDTHNELFDLATLTQLTELNIQKNKITEVTEGWLRGRVPNLHTLVLDHNEISRLGENVFAEMKALKHISLSDNKITEIRRSMFPGPAYQLVKMDFSHNQLHSVPSDIFNDMPSLQEVVLSYNDIKTLPEQTWMDIWGRLNQVLLYENSLVCDEKMQWMKDLRQPNRLEGTCMAPSDMRGRSISDLFGT